MTVIWFGERLHEALLALRMERWLVDACVPGQGRLFSSTANRYNR